MSDRSDPAAAPPAQGLLALPAHEAAARIAAGTLRAEALVQACLARIALREPAVRAWAHLDPDAALREARARDASPPLGPLHGVPVAIKDVIDVEGMPTGMGSPIHDGHRPRGDAACVARLRAAGAVILGKTVTAELAGSAPGPTRHPRAPGHTPGGSSSGSAAAVADGMVPLALGTQTGGSIIRPAAYCGIVGFKPSYGTVGRQGLKLAAESFDTIGPMARSVADVALAWRVLSGSRLPLPPALPPGPPPRLRLFRDAAWDHASAEVRDGLRQAEEALRARGWTLEEFRAPPGFDALREVRVIINGYERAQALAWERQRHGERLSPGMRAVVDAGAAVPLERYVEALHEAERWRHRIASELDGWSGLLVPAASGEAPPGLASTGSPEFQELWTLLRLPTIALPWGTGPSGLPLGIQLVGRAHGDAELLGLAAALHP